jgi:hypothetical protein
VAWPGPQRPVAPLSVPQRPQRPSASKTQIQVSKPPLCMKIEKGAAFKLLVQEQHFLSHSSQHCQIIDGLRGQTGVNLSLVGLELSEKVKDDLDEVEDDNVETEQNTKTLIQADAHVV